MIDAPDEQVCMAGVRGPLRLEDLLFMARKANRLAPLQVVRADRVAGVDHVRAAALHADRAFAEGRNQADRREVEFTRHLSGRRTIQEAIGHMGVPDGADAAVVIGLGEARAKAVEYFVDMLGLVADDAVIDATPDTVRAFGIPEAALEATDPALHGDLVLEAVAAVDTLRT